MKKHGVNKDAQMALFSFTPPHRPAFQPIAGTKHKHVKSSRVLSTRPPDYSLNAERRQEAVTNGGPEKSWTMTSYILGSYPGLTASSPAEFKTEKAKK